MAVQIDEDSLTASLESGAYDPDLERIEIELLLEGVFRHYGFDFRSYAYASIRRRLWKRIEAEGLSTVSELQTQILHHPPMMEKLLLDLSINVTAMFRDPNFYKAFREKVVPLLRTYPYIRVWHAGCATGEEVYSMAILLQEEGLYERSRIYATGGMPRKSANAFCRRRALTPQCAASSETVKDCSRFSRTNRSARLR